MDKIENELEQQVLEFFEEHWENINRELKGTSRKELARDMFMNGFLLATNQFTNTMEELDKNPEEMEKFLKQLEEKK